MTPYNKVLIGLFVLFFPSGSDGQKKATYEERKAVAVTRPMPQNGRNATQQYQLQTQQIPETQQQRVQLPQTDILNKPR